MAQSTISPNAVVEATPPLATWARLAVALLVALLAALASYFNQFFTPLYQDYFATRGSGDFYWAWRAANDLLAGRDVYSHVFHANAIPYPMTTVLIAMPFALLPEHWAGPMFFGVSCGLLTWGMLRTNELYRLLVFASGPFWFALISIQWSPLVMAAALVPALMVFVLGKPHIGLPVFLTYFSWRGFVACAALGLLSLLLAPTWVQRWFFQVNDYKGFVPLLLLPVGPMLLLALLAWRATRARLLALLACVPQHYFFYDQLLLLLIPQNRREMLVGVLFSWLPIIGSLLLPGFRSMWLVVGLYLPMLALILWSERAQLPTKFPLLQRRLP
nr:hypothetical protein [Chloroflexaceae bacterium]